MSTYSKFITLAQLTSVDVHLGYKAIHDLFVDSGDYSIGFTYDPNEGTDEVYEPADGYFFLGNEAADPEKKRILGFPKAQEGEFVGFIFIHPDY
jgi:hypothetical protein